MTYDDWKTTPPDDDPEGEHQDEDREPPDPDGEDMFRDRDAEYRDSQEQARTLK